MKKKIFGLIALLVLTGLTAACDQDKVVVGEVVGIWIGQFPSCIEKDGGTYYSDSTVICFCREGQNKNKGYGSELSYYKGAPVPVARYEFKWEVYGEQIFMKYYDHPALSDTIIYYDFTDEVIDGGEYTFFTGRVADTLDFRLLFITPATEEDSYFSFTGYNYWDHTNDPKPDTVYRAVRPIDN